MARATSIKAFEEIRDAKILGRRRFQTYDGVTRATLAGKDMTQMETVRFVQQTYGAKITDHSITNRFAELERIQLVEVVRVRKCTVTGKEVGAYISTDFVPTKQFVRETLKREPKDQQIQRLTRELQEAHLAAGRYRKRAEQFAVSIVALEQSKLLAASEKAGLEQQIRTLNLELDAWRNIANAVKLADSDPYKVLERIQVLQFERDQLIRRLNDYDKRK